MAGPRPRQIQRFADAQKVIDRYFVESKTYKPGDLVTTKDVQEIFKRLELYGWKVSHQKEVLKRVIKEGDFLDQVLSTEKGREFLSKISSAKNGIDRLDRMSRLPNGQASVTDLIHKIPNGHEWIVAMTSTKGGHQLGESLSKSAAGKDFNKPTGRFYSAQDLSKILKFLFQQRPKNRPIINKTRSPKPEVRPARTRWMLIPVQRNPHLPRGRN